MKLLFAYVMWLLIQVGTIPTTAWVFPNHNMPSCHGFSVRSGSPTCDNVPAWQVFKAQITADPGPNKLAMTGPSDEQDEDKGEDGTSSISNGF